MSKVILLGKVSTELEITKTVGYIRVLTQGQVRNEYGLVYQRDEIMRHCAGNRMGTDLREQRHPTVRKSQERVDRLYSEGVAVPARHYQKAE